MKMALKYWSSFLLLVVQLDMRLAMADTEETTFAQPSVTTYMHDNMPRRRVCSWGFKDINPNSPDPVCYRTMEAATYEEAQRTCRRMFADILTLPDERYSIEGEFSLEWKILCEVGLNQNKRHLWLPLRAIQRYLGWEVFYPEFSTSMYMKSVKMIWVDYLEHVNTGDSCHFNGVGYEVGDSISETQREGTCGRIFINDPVLINDTKDSCPGYYDRHAERVSMCGVRGTPMEPSFYDCKEQLPYICINGGTDYSLLQNFPGCKIGWVRALNSMNCLKEFTIRATFEEAQLTCRTAEQRSQLAMLYRPEIYEMLLNMDIDGPVWLGAYHNDSIHWDDGHVDSVHNYPWLSNDPEEPNPGCLSWWPSSVEAYIKPCIMQLGVLCVTSFNANDVDPPHVLMEQNELRVSSDDIYSEDVLFTCQPSNYHPSLPIIWVVNGIPFSNGPPPSGLLLRTSDLMFTLSHMHSTQSPGMYAYGDHRCEVWGHIPDTRAVSPSATIRLNDIIRLQVLTILPMEDLFIPWRNECTTLFCTDFVESYESNPAFLYLFSFPHNDDVYTPTHLIITTTRNISEDTVLTPLLLIAWNLMYFEYAMPEYFERLSGQRALHAEVYELVNQAVNMRLAGHDNKWLEFNLNLTGVHISADSCCCYTRTSVGQDGGVLHWKTTSLGEVATSTELCLWDQSPLATSECIQGLNDLVYWGPIRYFNCTPSVVSQVTVQLEDLAKKNINISNVAEVSMKLNALASNVSDWVPADAVYTAVVVENIGTVKGAPVQVGIDILAAVNQFMNLDTEILAEATQLDNSSNRIISSLEQFAATTKLDNANSSLLIAPQVALGIYDVNETFPRGFAVFNGIQPGSGNARVMPINEEDLENATFIDSGIILSDGVIDLVKTFKARQDELLRSTTDPDVREDIKNHPVRISFAAFEHSSLFVSKRVPATEVLSSVIAASIHGYIFSHKNLSSGTDPSSLQQIHMKFRTHKPRDENICVFWDFLGFETQGGWSSDGCMKTAFDETHTSCACNHTTNFAVITDWNHSRIPSGHGVALSYISLIGIGLSIAGLILTLVTFIIFRKGIMTEQLASTGPQRDTHVDKQILFNLCLALLAMYTTFLIGIQNTKWQIYCKIVSGLLHYFTLASFGWMFVESVRQFLRYYKCSHVLPERFVLTGSVVSWGVPFTIVIPVAVTNSNLTISKEFCWLRDEALYFGFLLPVGLIILSNSALYSMAIYRITRGRVTSSTALTSINMHIRASILLFVLIGASWVFGFLAIAHARLVFQYLFCVFNSAQGFVIFWLYCYRDPRVRQNLIRYCGCESPRRNETHDMPTPKRRADKPSVYQETKLTEIEESA